MTPTVQVGFLVFGSALLIAAGFLMDPIAKAAQAACLRLVWLRVYGALICFEIGHLAFADALKAWGVLS